MNLPVPLPLLAFGLVAVIAGCFYLLHIAERQDRLTDRVALAQRSGGLSDRALEEPAPAWLRPLLGAGNLITESGMLPRKTLEEMRGMLAAAGFRSAAALNIFVGAKIGLLIILPLIALSVVQQLNYDDLVRYGIVGAAGVVGLLAPEYIVKRIRTRHLKEVERGLPDALDMLVICAEAGLGLEPAFERVATEIAPAHAAVAEEMRQTAHELRISADRRVALANLGLRTGLDSLKRLGGTLVQTMQYGTPLSDALRTLAAEMRDEALARFEEQAGRLPVLLTLPMIGFILPCVFLVVGGPAAMQIAAMLRNF